MIQRAKPTSIPCQCGRTLQLVESKGCPGTKWHLECHPCGHQTARYNTVTDAFKAVNHDAGNVLPWKVRSA